MAPFHSRFADARQGARFNRRGIGRELGPRDDAGRSLLPRGEAGAPHTVGTYLGEDAVRELMAAIKPRKKKRRIRRKKEA